MTRTVFLDRDGTINVKAPEGEYVTSVAGFEYLPGAEEAVRLLDGAGYRVIVVTNQRGIALGRMDAADVVEIHERLTAELPVAAVYVCPHERGACDCRKPAVGLFRQAQRDYPDIDLPREVLIGDADSDVEAGRRLGCRTIRVGPPPLPSLLDAARELAG